MSSSLLELSPSGGARGKLLSAAICVIREKGYAATTVDVLCATAGVTKGAFFHHFPTKDALALAALAEWTAISEARFAAAPYHQLDDPLDRILGYLDFRKAMFYGSSAEYSCLAGMLAQEVSATHPEIRRAADVCISGQAACLDCDIAEAMELYRVRGSWSAESLALHIQVVIQGAYILAKVQDSAAVAETTIDHLGRYIELLFDRSALSEPESGNATAASNRAR